MTIREIENLSEQDVQKMENEKFDVKGYNVYLVDLGEYFGYSTLVFKNHHQIKYANDYYLHHPGKTAAELKPLYLEKLNEKLFTEEEIEAPLKSADELRMKRDFLVNLYGLQVDYVSYFQVYHNEEERKSILKSVEGMHDNLVGQCWMKDKAFVDKHTKLWKTLMDREKHAMEDFEYCKSAFLYEMFNHEYGINWQADYDVISCFKRISYKDEGTMNYLERSGFTEVQKKAYIAAKSEYLEKTKEF